MYWHWRKAVPWMNKWEMVRLGDVIIFDKQNVLPENISSEHFYIGLEDIEKETGNLATSLRLAIDCDIKSNKFLFNNDHILYGKLRPNLNKVASPEFIGVCSTDIYPLLPRKNISVKGYICAILKSKRFVYYASSKVTGINLPRVNEKTISDYIIPLPPLPIQQKIADILDRANALIEKRKAQIEKLDLLVKSQFIEMFGDPVTNPMGWEVMRLEQIADSRLGKMLDSKKQTGNNSYPYLANFNVQWFRFDLNRLGKMDFNEADRVEFALEYGDLLICEGGEVGRTAIWKGEIKDCYFQKALHRARCRKDICTPEFLAWALYYKAKTANFDGLVTSATIAHLTGEKLKRLSVQLPPLALQTQFAAFVERVEAQKAKMKQGLELMELEYKSLMQKCFNGELS